MKRLLIAAALLAASTTAQAQVTIGTRILAMGGYVDNKCSQYVTDKEAFLEAFEILGESVEELQSEKVLRQGSILIGQLLKMGPPREVCDQFWEMYGDKGSDIPGLLKRK